MSWKRLIDEDLARELRQRPSPFRKERPRKTVSELWPVAAEREAWAAKWLAFKLDDTTKRGDFETECIKRWEITARAYKHRVWPAARARAGLAPQSLPGPKRQPNK